VPFNINAIRIVSITHGEAPKGVSGDPKQFTKVLFELGPGCADFPVYVARGRVSDENIVPVARHYLHMIASDLADAISSWKMNDAAFHAAVSQ
jgi:hypothetical protein